MTTKCSERSTAEKGPLKIVTDGVPCWPNFFDGRALTGKLFREQREAVLALAGRLGRAVGPGVVEGMRVSSLGGTGRKLLVSAGTAINGEGETLCLEADASLELPVPGDVSGATTRFRICEREGRTRESVPPATYLLVAEPWRSFKDAEPRVTRGVGADRVLGCGYRCEAHGLAFRLLELPGDAPCDTSDERFRNLLAFWCWHGLGLWSGDFRRSSEGIAVRGASEGGEGVAGLEARHVPLAVFRWQGGKVVDLDMWAARRDPGPPAPEDEWSAMVGAATARRGRSRFLGFQAFLAELAAAGDAGLDQIRSKARFFPPAWMAHTSWLEAAKGFMGNVSKAGVLESTRTITPEEARLALERSFLLDPVDLDARPSGLAAYLVVRDRWGGPFCVRDDQEARAEAVREEEARYEARRAKDMAYEARLETLYVDYEGDVSRSGKPPEMEANPRRGEMGDGGWVLFVKQVRDVLIAAAPSEALGMMTEGMDLGAKTTE